ncbi:MAG: hypothetical protein HeimC3_11610 [Candidatus Heimdallarchaeota archaeon LC_3]|nr:MAG: hypothetical protein HeimC3_11610 [Candidatus Heimdallarchaeota archaeon LC_3]
MPTAYQYPKTKIEDLILLRLKSLLDVNLLNKDKYEYLINQISSMESNKSKYEQKELISIGLLYNITKSLTQTTKIEENVGIHNPYDNNRNFEEISTLINFLKKKKIILKGTTFKKQLLDHFANYEKNINRISKLRNQEKLFLTNDNYKSQLNLFLDQIISESQKKIKLDELDPKLEESILTLFEKKFSNFTKTLNYTIENIEWDETLIDRARNKLYIPSNQLASKVPSNVKITSVNLQDKNIESNIHKTANKLETSDLKIKSNTSLLDTTNDDKLTAPSPIKKESDLRPSDFVGKILVKISKKDFQGIGILNWPVIDQSGKIFFPVDIEIGIEMDQSDALFREVQSLRITGISDTSQSRQDRLREEISDFLNIPENISLNPSFIKEYLAKRDVSDQHLVFKEKLLRTEYYPFDKISIVPEKGEWVVIQTKVKPRFSLKIDKKYPSETHKQDKRLQKKKLNIWTEESIGTVSNQFIQNDGYYLLVEYDFPTQPFLEKLIPKIRGYDPNKLNELWYLRFFVSKKIDVFEGEALLYWNLWKFVWNEKIPILPFDIRSAFLGIIPSQTIDRITDSVTLKRNQLPQPILREEIFSYFLTIKKNGKELGKVVGTTINENTNELEILYSDLKPELLFKKLDKDPSNINKLFNRIKRALNLKEEESKTPKAIITYLTFYSAQFETFEDLSQFTIIQNWLINTFSLKRILYQEIKIIDYENEIIEVK